MTVLDLIKELGPRINDQDGRAFPMIDAVNNVLRALCRELKDRKSDLVEHDLEIIFQPDDRSAALPADFEGLRGRPWVVGTKRSLNPLPDRTWRMEYEGRVAAIPTFYALSGNSLEIFPGAQGIVTIKGRYYSAVPAVVTVAETIPLPQFEDTVRAGVMMMHQNGLVYCVTNDFRAFIEEAVVRQLRRRDDHARTSKAYYM